MTPREELNALRASQGEVKKMTPREELNALRAGANTAPALSRDPVSTGEAAPRNYALSEVPLNALSNIPKDGGKFLGSIASAIGSPLQTIGNIADVAAGGLRNALPDSVSGFIDKIDNQDAVKRIDEKADAVGQMYADDYGGYENIKRKVAEQPVSVLSDLATVLTGGGAAVAKLPGLAGKAGKAAASVGRAVDPINIAGKIAKPIVKPVVKTAVSPVLKGVGTLAASLLGNLGTHTGTKSVETAASAGYGSVTGRAKEAKDFRDAISGKTDIDEIVPDLRKVIDSGILGKGKKEYKAGIEKLGKDTTILDFNPVKDAVTEAFKVGEFKGKSISRSTDKIKQQILKEVERWGKYDKSDYHTAEGLDGLKKSIGDIVDDTQPRTPSRVVATRVYNAIKDQIVKQSPDYAETMKGYGDTIREVKEIERTLSLGDKASSDQAVRKLQSVLRDNVNTNFGNRVKLVEKLKEAGASGIMEKLAGNSMRSFTPRGLAGSTAVGTSLLGHYVGGPGLAIPILAAQSPRLVGEGAYYGGKAAGVAGNVAKRIPKGSANTAAQVGRMNEAIDKIYNR